MNGSKAILFSIIFLALVSIASVLLLYLQRISIVIFVLCAVISFFVLSKVKNIPDAPSAAAFCISILVALLAAYPFVFSGFVAASADPAAHISSLAIGETVPQNYGQFSDLEYRYQLGFPLIAKMFFDLLPFIESGIIVWALGVAFAFLSAILVYLCAREMFSSERAGLFALTLFIGSKLVFQNMYWGQYTFMLASMFFLAALLMFLRKEYFAAALLFPAILLAHPGVAFYTIIFFAAFGIFYKKFKEIALFFGAGVLALPSFFLTYIHFLGNYGSEVSNEITLSTLASSAASFPLWIGGLIFILSIASIILMVKSKKRSENEVFFASVFLVASLVAIYFLASGRLIGGRVVELAMFCGLFLSVGLFDRFKDFTTKNFHAVLFAVLIISLALFFTSGQLSHLREGSKITPQEIEFARAFASFDPSYAKTFFMVNHGGKIAEVSHKIPYNVMSDWYLSYDPRIASDDPNYEEAIWKLTLSERAILNQCASCVAREDFLYLVTYAQTSVPQDIFVQVFEFGGFKVYKKAGI